MEKIILRLKGEQIKMLSYLVDRGYFNTKSEALRAGIILTFKEFNSITKKNNYKIDTETLTDMKLAEPSFSEFWKDEPDGLWESYLTEEEKNGLKRKK
jgi:Arc/MetJ-type ribon-helix-helix transcriptional regulator